jgi:hypothetical protein
MVFMLTPLEVVLQGSGKPEEISLLKETKELNKLTAEGDTVLTISAMLGLTWAIQSLLDNPNISSILNIKNRKGYSCLKSFLICHKNKNHNNECWAALLNHTRSKDFSEEIIQDARRLLQLWEQKGRIEILENSLATIVVQRTFKIKK